MEDALIIDNHCPEILSSTYGNSVTMVNDLPDPESTALHLEGKLESTQQVLPGHVVGMIIETCLFKYVQSP